MNRRLATQHEKHISFKRAYETLSAYQNSGEYLAAYVVAFSIVEDRIRAMYAKRYLHDTGQEIPEKEYNQGLMRICSKLQKASDMTADEVAVIEKHAAERNRNLHAAMWRLDAVDSEIVKEAVELARKLEKIKARQARTLKTV